MIDIERPADIAHFVGQQIGVSKWIEVDQTTVNNFAEATGDHQWIHVDVERASRERLDGHTIAHGFLILSLIPRMVQTIYRVKQRSHGFNIGLNHVRFTGSVPVGARIRLSQHIKSVEPIENGVQIIADSMIEIEGEEVPAVVAEILTMMFEKSERSVQ